MAVLEPSREAPGASLVSRNRPLDALRAALVLLVVAHHAVLAYHPYAPPPAPNLVDEPRMWLAFPIIDVAKAPGIDLLVGWNDTFFMSLFFLLSGLFVVSGLRRKGAAGYLGDRLRRLGLPFVVAAGVLAPLAYLPTYLAASARGVPQPGSFADQWLALGKWPAGPAWFLWVLLLLGALAAFADRLAPRLAPALGRSSERLGERPILYLAAILALSSLAYLPLAATLRPETWAAFGPFWIQAARSLHYALYFALGAGLGAAGLDRGLLAPGGRLGRRWALWVVGAALSFGFAVAVFLAILGSYQSGGPSTALSTLGNFTFVLCCAASCLAALALALRFGQRTGSVVASLSACAYGIYLVHYVVVSWLELGMLDWTASGWTKAAVAVAAAIAISWGLTALARRIPAVARIL